MNFFLNFHEIPQLLSKRADIYSSQRTIVRRKELTFVMQPVYLRSLSDLRVPIARTQALTSPERDRETILLTTGLGGGGRGERGEEGGRLPCEHTNTGRCGIRAGRNGK